MSRIPRMAAALLAASMVASAPASGQELRPVAGRPPSQDQRVVFVTGSTGGMGREEGGHLTRNCCWQGGLRGYVG